MSETTISIDEMRKELEANGVTFEWTGDYYHSAIMPSGIEVVVGSGGDSGTEVAWQAYQREKRYAEMEALLGEIIDSWAVARNDSEPNAVIVQASKNVELEAKKLLNKP